MDLLNFFLGGNPFRNNIYVIIAFAGRGPLNKVLLSSVSYAGMVGSVMLLGSKEQLSSVDDV
jgi:hypothetical protein